MVEFTKRKSNCEKHNDLSTYKHLRLLQKKEYNYVMSISSETICNLVESVETMSFTTIITCLRRNEFESHPYTSNLFN